MLHGQTSDSLNTLEVGLYTTIHGGGDASTL